MNDYPTVANALADQAATEDSAFSYQFAANSFGDVDAGDTLSYSATLADGSALPGWLSFNAATRTFSGTPANGDVGAITVKVTATDGSSAAVSDEFTLTVANVVPTVANALADQAATEDSAFSYQFAANSFADGSVANTLTYTATLADGSALPGWLSFDASTRTFSGTPANGDVGKISVTVTAADGNTNGTVSDTFDLTVANVNDAPIAVADTATTPEDTPVTIDVLANDSDVDGPSLIIKSASVPPEQGTVAIVNGKLVFTPAKDFNGTATITYVASDGALDTALTAVTVTVNPVVDSVTVSSPRVNEASPYAVFMVTGGAGESVALDLSAGSATGAGVDFGASNSSQLEVSTDGGRSWAPYSAAVTFPADGKLLARTPVKQDTVYEGAETLTLKATPAGGAAAAGTATIVDDGTGTIFSANGSEDSATRKDDDRPLTIAPVTVNEASPYAVFRVEASGGQQFTLSLRDGPVNPDPALGTATAGADYRNSLETYDGVKWVAYTPGSLVSVPSGGSVLLVRVPIVNDSEYEGAHAFTLAAIIPDAVPVTGNGIIGDYGTGAFFNDSGAEDRLATKDDDRGIQVDSPIVNEGSDFVVFTVKGPAGPVGLRMPVSYETDEPIATGVDKSPSNIQFWNGLAWQTYNGSNASIPAGGILLVRVGISGEHDLVKEGSEHFALIVSRNGQDSVGEASVRDDGTGVIFQFAANGQFTGTTSSDLDDDFDQDGITPTTEEALATLLASQGIGDAVRGDLNGDGLQDAEQNALATLAWTSKEHFEEGNNGTLTESKAIISLAVVDDASSKTVSKTTQLLAIQVLKYQEVDAATQVTEETGSKTVTLADGFTEVKTLWDPIRFAISGHDTDNDGQIDTSLVDVSYRPGTQVRILIDIRASGLTTQDVNGYIKYVSQQAIDAAGGQLIDLDGQPITKAGWYDFTQRQPGGDGAHLVDENGDGKIDFIELIITDNAFGDNDSRANRILDPGAPVLIDKAALTLSAQRPPEQVPYASAKGEIEFSAGPSFEYSAFDSTLYSLAADASPQALGLIERMTWHWSDQDRDWANGRHTQADAIERQWAPLVMPDSVASLQLFRGVGDQFGEHGSAGSFAVPSDAFVHTRPEAEVTLTAELADGSALPGWIRFDARSGKFEFMPPADFKGELRIKLTARDQQGREAATLFRFQVGDKQVDAGRAGLSEKMREASQRHPAKRAAAAVR